MFSTPPWRPETSCSCREPPPDEGARIAAARTVRGLGRGVLAWLPRLTAAAFFGLFLLLPLGESLRGAFFDVSGKPTVAYVLTLFESGIYLDGIRNALVLA